MAQLISWIEIALLLPLLGAAWAAAARHLAVARQRALIAAGLTLICCLAAWLDFAQLGFFAGSDGFALLAAICGPDCFGIDTLNAPMLPLTALLGFVILLATLKTRPRRFSFARSLLLEAGLLAALSARASWLLMLLLGLLALPQLHELHERNRSLRPYLAHMGVSMLLLTSGGLLSGSAWSFAGFALMAAGLAIRAGLVPGHCWVIDLFEQGAFGTALLTLSPLIAVYAAARLLLPAAPLPVLMTLAAVALLTALYAAAMSTIQLEARRFVCYFLLSHSALVLAGLALGTELGMTAGLLLWISVPLAMMGLGLTVRCLEARTGRLVLHDFLGFHAKAPTLAALFLTTGLAAVGFPGTLGFLGFELLINAATQTSQIFGLLVIAATAFNGIALLRVYALLFLGPRHLSGIDLGIRRVELAGLLSLVVLLISGTLWPQPGIDSRRRAVETIRAAGEAPDPRF